MISAHATYARERAEMVERQLRRRGIRDERVLEAMRAVPRHEFVAPEHRGHAYQDRPVPIGAGQTISQPYMVAVMTQALHLAGGEVVLEVGTGSGYQTAILARLAARVYTIERETELLRKARETLERLERDGIVEAFKVEFIEGDGSAGFPPGAPYDAILVAAAAPAVPPSLLEQLGEGGRLVIPIGAFDSQVLHVLQRHGGHLLTRTLDEVRFVPLVGREGWRE